MTPDRRTAIFERALALQNVTIDHAIERGREYLVERLSDCRRRIDEAGQLAVEVKRAIFAAKVARRAARAAMQMRASHENTSQHNASEDLYDELKALEECLNVCRATLRTADSDIRLAAALLDTQLKIGEVTPPPRDVDVARGDIPSPSDLPEGGSRLTEELLRGRVHPQKPDVLPESAVVEVDLATLINDTSEVVTRPLSATVESDDAISVEDLLR